jgi:hypothetical protein
MKMKLVYYTSAMLLLLGSNLSCASEEPVEDESLDSAFGSVMQPDDEDINTEMPAGEDEMPLVDEEDLVPDENGDF